jgi:hypothetical protein
MIHGQTQINTMFVSYDQYLYVKVEVKVSLHMPQRYTVQWRDSFMNFQPRQWEVSGHAQTTLPHGHRVPGPQTRMNVLFWLGIKATVTHNCIIIADVWTVKYSPLTTTKLQNSNYLLMSNAKKKRS